MNCYDFLHSWRNWVRPFVIALYLILLLIALPLLVVEFNIDKTDTHIQAWFVGGMFVVMAIPISLWGILQHLVHYTNPQLQRHIIRILWMVPIYAGDAGTNYKLQTRSAAVHSDKTSNNCYCSIAVYCLILFYVATKEELQPLHPLSKFMCIKAVVFLSFWQQVLIALLVQVGVITDQNSWLSKDIANGLQDFCICVEMFVAALAHYYSFSHKPYIDPMAEQNDCCASFLSMWDVSDVRDDVYEHVRHVGKTVTRPLRSRFQNRSENERTPLLRGNESGDDSGTFSSGALSQSAPHLGHASADVHASVDGIGVDPELTASAGTIGSLSQSADFEQSKQLLTASMNNYLAYDESVSSQLGTDEVPQVPGASTAAPGYQEAATVREQSLPKEEMEERALKEQLESDTFINSGNEDDAPDTRCVNSDSIPKSGANDAIC